MTRSVICVIIIVIRSSGFQTACHMIRVKIVSNSKLTEFYFKNIIVQQSELRLQN